MMAVTKMAFGVGFVMNQLFSSLELELELRLKYPGGVSNLSETNGLHCV